MGTASFVGGEGNESPSPQGRGRKGGEWSASLSTRAGTSRGLPVSSSSYCCILTSTGFVLTAHILWRQENSRGSGPS